MPTMQNEELHPHVRGHDALPAAGAGKEGHVSDEWKRAMVHIIQKLVKRLLIYKGSLSVGFLGHFPCVLCRF